MPRVSRRPAAALAAAAVVALLSSCAGDPPAGPDTAPGAGSSAAPSAGPATASPSPGATGNTSTASPGTDPVAATPQVVKELPRGGTTLFPRYRLFGYSGYPGIAALGRLGIGDLDERGREMQRRGRAYARGREVLPVFELIATIAHRTAGDDGNYNTRTDDKVIAAHLAAARRHRGLLLLNIQPGRADFLPEVKAYEKWLREPDVSVALDPEWAVEKGKVPGRVYGVTTGKEIDGVAAYLSRLVRVHGLPEKPLVFHQVARSVVRAESGLRRHPGVVAIKSVDGIGSARMKRETWTVLVRAMPRHVRGGFKLFYEEDAAFGPLMTPRQVLALRPQPEYILFE